MSTPTRKSTRSPVRRRDPADPAFKAVELAQRGRMVLDVAAADLEVAEAALGPFHETTWYFRYARDEALRAWDRLRAQYGGAALEAALEEPPVAVLTLGGGTTGLPAVTLISIAGTTYRAERIAGTELAPVLWRLTRLPPRADGPYYACRLHDGSYQCDCATWIYTIADGTAPALCKHLAALDALGWL
ncbi:MAG TPA: hypothetical protein VF590_20860 [Isosphaeraceae bacterium]